MIYYSTVFSISPLRFRTFLLPGLGTTGRVSCLYILIFEFFITNSKLLGFTLRLYISAFTSPPLSSPYTPPS